MRRSSEGKVTRVGAVILVNAGFVALAWGRQLIARTESLLRRLGCRFVLTGVLDGALVGGSHCFYQLSTMGGIEVSEVDCSWRHWSIIWDPRGVYFCQFTRTALGKQAKFTSRRMEVFRKFMKLTLDLSLIPF